MAIHRFATHEHVYPPPRSGGGVTHIVHDTPVRRVKPLYRGTQYVWYALYVIETLLGLRFALRLLGANAGAPFADLVYGLSGIFLDPFRYILPASVIDRGAGLATSVVEWSTLLAMLVYWLLAIGIVKLIVMNRPVSEAEAHTRLIRRDRI